MKEKKYALAASYLMVLPSLESASVSRSLALTVLDIALETNDWALARDLIRFLQATADVPHDEGRFSPLPPQVRGGGGGGGGGGAVGCVGRYNRDPGYFRSLYFTFLPSPSFHCVLRFSSLPILPCSHMRIESFSLVQLSEDMCDGIFKKYALKLLRASRLRALGKFAANLNFPLQSWLRSVR